MIVTFLMQAALVSGSLGEGGSGLDPARRAGIDWTAQRIEERSPPGSPSRQILETLRPAALRALCEEVLERNPGVAAAAASARAAAERIPQAAALPDPVAGLTAYLLTPETRVGSQRAMATFSQKLPWFGKLALAERRAVLEAAAAEARVEAKRLELLTQARRLYFEIAFLDALSSLTAADLETLRHYEELARARYESGVGLEQGVIKLQAEITRDQTKLLQIADRRAAALASLDALRDHRSPVTTFELPAPRELDLTRDLRARAMRARPEITAARADIERARLGVELAHKERKPDLNLGLTYGFVERRDDPAAFANPPADDGQDVVGITATIHLPVRKGRLEAGVREATQTVLAQQEHERTIETEIDRSLGELTQRLSLLWRQIRLFEDVLVIQAEESLNSAEAAYAAGALNALDLLDAERVLLDVQIGIERARADYAIHHAELEGAVAGSVLPAPPESE